MELDTAAMVKKSDTIRHRYQGQKLSCKYIYSLNRKRRGRSRYLLSVDIQLDAASEGEEVIPAKLVYLRSDRHCVLRYMFLAVGIRENADLQTSGPMFCLVADELADISFTQAFEKLQLFLEKLLEEFHVPEQTILAFVTDFVSRLPTDIAHFLPLN